MSSILSFHIALSSTRSRGSSGSIVSDYGLDDRAIGVRSPAEANDFSSNLCLQTGSEAHPASCTMGTGGTLPGGKARPGRDADHLPHLVPRSRMSRSYTPLPPSASMACSGTALLYFLLPGRRRLLVGRKLNAVMFGITSTVFLIARQFANQRCWGSVVIIHRDNPPPPTHTHTVLN
jgi:hypothetical protein